MAPKADTAKPLELSVHGLHCAGCVRTVEGALQRVPGIARASVNLATERASVWLAEGATVAPDAMLKAVRAAGYEAQLATAAEPAATSEGRRAGLNTQLRRLLLAAAIGLPVILAHLVHALPAAAVPAVVAKAMAPFTHWPVQLPLTLIVLITAGGPMIVGAGRALMARSASMDLLVSLGALTALGSSLIGVAAGAHELVLFDAALMITLFVGIGKHLEARARGQASGALELLLSRLPRMALRVVDNRTETVPVEIIRPGDVVRVAAHTPVPVDGAVIAGRAAVDEALVTGESIPVERTVGQTVLGGTRVADGLIDVRATAVGSASAAARIAQLVAQAQASKPPWQRFADRAAAVFVPVVLVLALGTFVGWKWFAGADTFWAVQRLIAVLVVACPCALGLAIPTAVLVGTTRAAEHGILVRDAAALEAAGQVREVLLDKTGTLTVGHPELAHVQVFDGHGEADVLRAAAALEQLSEHPLAAAVVAAARQRNLALPQPVDFRSRPGQGLAGAIDRRRVVVGAATWLGENGTDTGAQGESAERLAAEGLSVVWVALDGRVAALLGLVDPVHPESAAAVADLTRLGVGVRILSGDREPAVRRIAQQLGITAFEAQLTPDEKLARVREVAARSGHVAMVGDGLNDAPALAAAQVGVAIGTGADVAREAADICLVGHSPRLIAQTIRISRASARVMKQNLAWAVLYNVIMLPAAMLAPVPPAVATVAMMFSSFSVVANSLRLRRAI